MAAYKQRALRESRARICTVAIFSLLTLSLAGCSVSGNQTASNAAVSMSMSPASLTLQTGHTQQFNATVTGSSNTAVTWSATGGSISASGMYTAPTTAGSYVVKATSMADSTVSASTTVSVTTTPVVAVTLSPPAASVVINGTQQFTATVTGSSNTAVTWTASGGSISSGGLYTAPGAAGSVTVTASSVADNTKLASATVTVTTVPVVLVTLSPTSASLLTNGTRQFTAAVTGSSNTAVTWSATGGIVSSSGFYTAPNTAGSFTVKATSVADNTKSASASMTVSAAVQHTVTLSWTASASSIAGYNVYRGNVSGGPYTKVNTVLEAASNFVDNSVTSGATYFYAVTAVDASAGESAFSNQVSVVVPTP
jgi:hypothetical protein